jgi:N-acetylmuramoyl-L-alanine amidase
MRALQLSLPVSLLLVSAAAAGSPATVMIDPGHGGTNTGAFGPEVRRHEKQLTLRLAERVASYLAQWLPGGRVLLTRARDEYLTLAQRVERANQARAGLFLSLHLNASEGRDRTGFESFILSRDASDREASRLALLENREAGRPEASRLGRDAVAAILSDLRHTAAHAESAGLARAVQRALRRVRGVERDRGVRQAPFDVLSGLRMPGVLIEAGYLDHPVEGRELAEPAVREGIAAAIASAVVEHLASLRSIPKPPLASRR